MSTALGGGDAGNTNGNAGGGDAGAGGSNGGGAASGGNSGSGNGTPSWRDSLPDDLKTNGALASFQDVNALAKSYLSAQALVGKKGVVVPGEKASEDEWKRFYKDIGQPEADKFEVKLPEGKKINEGFVSKFKEMAHKSGLLPKQAQGLLDWYSSFEDEAGKARLAEVNLEVNKNFDELKKEWGQGYDKQLALARMAVKDAGGEPFQKYLDETGLGNDTQIVRFMAKVGSMMGEDKLRGDGGGKFGQTTDELDKALQIAREKMWANPGMKSIEKEVEELSRQRWPST